MRAVSSSPNACALYVYHWMHVCIKNQLGVGRFWPIVPRTRKNCQREKKYIWLPLYENEHNAKPKRTWAIETTYTSSQLHLISNERVFVHQSEPKRESESAKNRNEKENIVITFCDGHKLVASKTCTFFLINSNEVVRDEHKLEKELSRRKNYMMGSSHLRTFWRVGSKSQHMHAHRVWQNKNKRKKPKILDKQCVLWKQHGNFVKVYMVLSARMHFIWHVCHVKTTPSPIWPIRSTLLDRTIQLKMVSFYLF